MLPHHFTPEEVTSTGSVTVAGQRIAYHAVAGTLVVHAKGWDDVTQRVDTEPEKKPEGGGGEADVEDDEGRGLDVLRGLLQGRRPVRNRARSPSSTTAARAPRPCGSTWARSARSAFPTPGDQHLPAAPYTLVNNEWSLLDATDVVFIDAPGAGFSRIAGPDKEKSFYGVDGDAHAFAEFITQFLGKYGRWNSPKYLFGESYGTTRSAVLIADLEVRRSVDFNGVILLSQILNFALYPGHADGNPGQDVPYELALPTYAATAWYHHKLGADVPADLKALVAEVERFALGEYALALQQGQRAPRSRPRGDRREAPQVHEPSRRLHPQGEAAHHGDGVREGAPGRRGERRPAGSTRASAGRRWTRSEKEPDYDPFSAAVGSAYVSAFNDYVRKDLQFGEGRIFHPRVEGLETGTGSTTG